MDVVRLRGHRRHHSIASSSSFLGLVPESGRPRAGEPSSPRVGCTGQIRITRSRTTTSRAAAGGAGAAAAGGTRHDRSSLLNLTMRIFSRRSRRRRASSDEAEVKEEVSVAEMDPPLPVAKHAEGGGKPAVRLWDRRCGVGSSIGALDVGLHEQRMQQLRRRCVRGA